MNYKKVGLGIALSTAISFMACGDDSSSSPVFDAPSNQNSSSSVGNSAPKSSPSEKSSSSVSEANSSSSATVSSSSVVKAEPCTFAATDNLWEMSYKARVTPMSRLSIKLMAKTLLFSIRSAIRVTRLV